METQQAPAATKPNGHAHINGWGADLDHKNRPAYPKERTPPRLEGIHWDQPEQQAQNVEILHSNERPGITPVFGTSVPPSFLILMLCVAGGMGFGALNEVVEFFATRLLPDTNVGDYENIGWDLVANLAGSLVAAAVIRRFEKKRLRSPGG